MKILSNIGLPTAIQHGDEIFVDKTGNSNVSSLRIRRNGRPLSIFREDRTAGTSFELPVESERVETVLAFVGGCCGLEVQLVSTFGRFVFQKPSPA